MNPPRDPARWDDRLAPPPGGLDDLRRRLVRHERRRRAARAATAAAAIVLVAAVVAVAVVPGIGPPSRRSPFADAPATFDAIVLGLADPPTEPVVVPPDARRDLAVLRLPTRTDRVALYLVGTRTHP